MDLDSTLCHCHHLTKRKIVNFVRQRRPQKASQISECFEAGSGCGWCIPFLVQIHREIVGGESSPEVSVSAEEYAAQRKRYLEELKRGTKKRNRYVPAGEPSPPVSPSRKGDAAEEKQDDFDYTRYFSRSRPDPEPETLE